MITRTPRLLLASLALATTICAAPVGHSLVAHADSAPDVTLDSLSPTAVIAGSQAQITIQCQEGCGPNDAISLTSTTDPNEEVADIEDVTYDPQANTETFTLPDTVVAGVYDVTVYGAGGADTLSSALTVSDPYTLTARVVNATIHLGGTVRVVVQTTFDPGSWSAYVTNAQGRWLPSMHIDYKDKGNGMWRVSITPNKHVAAGLKYVVFSGDENGQHVDQTVSFCLLR